MLEGREALTVIIPFDWPRPPLSLNDRPPHWATRNKEAQAVRDAAWLSARSKINRGELSAGEPVEVTLVWYVPDRIRRDADNPVATLKPICDGLVDAGLVPDDTPEWMDKRPVRIIYRKGQPGVELHIEPRAEVDARVARQLMLSMLCEPWRKTLLDEHPEACEAHDAEPWAVGPDVCGWALHLAIVAREARGGLHPN